MKRYSGTLNVPSSHTTFYVNYIPTKLEKICVNVCVCAAGVRGGVMCL